MRFAELVDTYALPARDREQAYPIVAPPPPAEVLRARVVRLARRGRRRLAYLDNTFPWARSGFRYHLPGAGEVYRFAAPVIESKAPVGAGRAGL